jgi:hypothetical protein
MQSTYTKSEKRARLSKRKNKREEAKMPLVKEAKDGKKLVEYLDTGIFQKVLLPCWHGVGDIVMFMAPLQYLKNKYPHIQIDVGLAKGLQQLNIIPDGVEIDGTWEKDVHEMNYDLVFLCHMPLEDANDMTKTKAEVCCERELGIPPIAGHLHIKSKPIVGVHFQNTSVGSVANVSEEIAQKVWNEIIEAGCIPLETLFRHGFHNPGNEKFPFVDNHVRDWPARLETLISLLDRCDFFIGGVSGNFHLALSLLPYNKVALVENKLRAEHFTKFPIQTFEIDNYQDGKVKEWLLRNLK